MTSRHKMLNYTLDQAEAKEARQNIAKHVQTELVSDQHNSEVDNIFYCYNRSHFKTEFQNHSEDLKLFEQKLAAHYQPSMFDLKRERVNHPGNPKRRLNMVDNHH